MSLSRIRSTNPAPVSRILVARGVSGADGWGRVGAFSLASAKSSNCGSSGSRPSSDFITCSASPVFLSPAFDDRVAVSEHLLRRRIHALRLGHAVSYKLGDDVIDKVTTVFGAAAAGLQFGEDLLDGTMIGDDHINQIVGHELGPAVPRATSSTRCVGGREIASTRGASDPSICPGRMMTTVVRPERSCPGHPTLAA